MPEHPAPPNLPVINVSQVKQLSPFRYPGGKTWLVPYARLWLQATTPTRLLEPFVGGGSVSLMALDEGLVQEAVIVEADKNVAAVWSVMLSDRAPDLAEFIRTFAPTDESVRACMNTKPRSTFERAKRSVVLNRCTRGGIMAEGVGLIKEGEGGKGIKSRWYPSIADRVMGIHAMRDRLTLITGDGLRRIASLGRNAGTAIYADPPYTVAGKRLYTAWDVNHQRLFRLCANAEGPVLMSYDETPEVVAMAEAVGGTWSRVPMKNTHHAVIKELLISFQPLDWLQNPLG